MKLMMVVLGDATGGRWQVVVDYAEVLRDSGHQVQLVLNSKKVCTSTHLPGGVDVVTLRTSGHYDLWATLKATNLIKIFQPDAVICHCGRSVSLMKRALRGRGLLVAVNHSNNVKRSVPADAYFNISTHIGTLLAAYPGARGRGYHIPNMVHMLEPLEWKEPTWHVPIRIGAFGRFDVVKGFHVFIEALNLLAQREISFQAQLGGDGIQKEELLVLIDHFHLAEKVHLPGWVTDQQNFFAETDIFCIPALSDAFGITPLEAAVAGVPIVASDAEGHLDMFQNDRHALLVPRGDAVALADALEVLCTDQSTAHRLAREAFTKVTEEYTRKMFSSRLNDALSDLISLNKNNC